MILLCGIPSETPLALLRQRLEARGLPFVEFAQRRFASMRLEFDIVGDRISGTLDIGDYRYPLEGFTGVYTRLMDDQNLPELQGEPADAPSRLYARALHDALSRWCEVAPVRVVNRTEPMGSNCSKPYQAQLIVQHGFRTPETLITNDPALVREFHAQHGRVIFKSMSGVRSIVQVLEVDDLARLDAIRWCPVQFQVFVDGTNVRVHTVGEEVFATAINTTATDYRYAHRQVGVHAELVETSLSDDVAERCVCLARALGLPFAGIDLKITPEGETYCLEVNPSPAYSYYESHTGQPISDALARYLSVGSANAV